MNIYSVLQNIPSNITFFCKDLKDTWSLSKSLVCRYQKKLLSKLS
jgi:hypothetical protein